MVVAAVSFRGCGLVLGWTGIDAGENILQSRRRERTRSPSSMGKFIYPRHPSGSQPLSRLCGPLDNFKICGELFALRFGSKQHGNDDDNQEENRADHHWYCEAHTHLHRQICERWRDQATPDRPLVIDKTGRCGPHLRWETLRQVARVLAVDRSAEDALSDETPDDPGRVLGP